MNLIVPRHLDVDAPVRQSSTQNSRYLMPVAASLVPPSVSPTLDTVEAL
jgi:hypothetical protein